MQFVARLIYYTLSSTFPAAFAFEYGHIVWSEQKYKDTLHAA
jgi:hypothetical protein